MGHFHATEYTVCSELMPAASVEVRVVSLVYGKALEKGRKTCHLPSWRRHYR